MASKKSAQTADREVSQAKATLAQVADLKKELRGERSVSAKLRVELAAAQAEISRKELWINRYASQLVAARKKLAKSESDAPVSERRAAMEAAKAEAMRTGRTVAVAI